MGNKRKKYKRERRKKEESRLSDKDMESLIRNYSGATPRNESIDLSPVDNAALGKPGGATNTD